MLRAEIGTDTKIFYRLRSSEVIWGHFKGPSTRRPIKLYQVNFRTFSPVYLPVCEYESVPSIILHDAIL